MCHSLIELSQFFCSKHRELLLALRIWVNKYMLWLKCKPTLVSPVILYVLCFLPRIWISPYCPLLLWSNQLSRSKLAECSLAVLTMHMQRILKCFVINHHDFLQDVLGPGLCFILKNKAQLQGYFFLACHCSCGSDPGIFSFFTPKIIVFTFF